MRRQQLTEAQITALLDPPTDQRELVRHYTLSAADLAAIRRCRGDHNRLGHALMLCYLRYPGRPLKAGERPPRPLLLFIAEQIDALPESIEDYLAAERNRQRHVAELQDPLGFRPPRRWAQSRPDANGRGVQHRQPRPAGLDGGLAYPGRDLCPGAPASDQPAAARAACGGVWRWLRLLLGWPVLSGRRLRPRREQHQCPLRR